MVERSGSVTDVAGSFLHHLQDICDMNVKVEFLKVTPAGFVMARQRSAQQQAWEPGRVEGGGWFTRRPWVSCSARSWSGALWGGGGGRPGKRKAWRTHWITTSNNVAWLCKQRQTGQTSMQKKKKKKSKTEWLFLGKCVWQPPRRKGRAASAICSADRGESPSPKPASMCVKCGKSETCTGLFSHILTLGKQSATRQISNLNDSKMYAWSYLTKLATEIF